MFRIRLQWIKTERERRKTQNNYTGSFHKPEIVMSPLHFQGEFTKNVISNYKCSLLNLARDFKCSSTTARDFQYSRTQSRDFYAQARKQETSNQTELQKRMFDTEHLIYNQRCSQYKSDTNS